VARRLHEANHAAAASRALRLARKEALQIHLLADVLILLLPVMCAQREVGVTVRRSTRPCEYLTEREIEKLIEAENETSACHGRPYRLSPWPTRH